MSVTDYEEWLPAYDHKGALIRIKELQEQVDALTKLNSQYSDDYVRDRDKIIKLQKQVDAVKALPDKWSKRTFTDLPPQFESELYQDAYARGQCKCAKQLQQALEQKK